jgi:hypothetical protein
MGRILGLSSIARRGVRSGVAGRPLREERGIVGGRFAATAEAICGGWRSSASNRHPIRRDSREGGAIL